MRPSHNSVVAVLKRQQDSGDVQVLLLKCLPFPNRPEDEVFYKLPGGKGECDESPEDTARRETKQETGLRIPKKASLRPINSAEAGYHTKHGFWAWRDECKGSLRKGPYNDRRTRIVGSVWVSIDEALTLISPRQVVGSHHSYLEHLKRLAPRASR